MAPRELPAPAELEKELEHGPVHFAHHFADALAVIGYGHPVQATRATALSYYVYMAEELFHWTVEDRAAFYWRHRDRVPHE
jgi:hypothetical protein